MMVMAEDDLSSKMDSVYEYEVLYRSNRRHAR